MEDVFIFTEAYNCGLILKKCLESFFEHHDNIKIHIFGKHTDFKQIKEIKNRNIEYIELSMDESLKQLYTQGHAGTAYIFAKVLRGDFGNYKKIIHFDSDVIFRKECISDIIEKFNEGYDIVGPRRAYKNNVANKSGLYDNLPDVSSTYFFGVNLEKISEHSFEELHRMVIGASNKYPTIDFFDPVSFDILLDNNGKIFYLDFNDYGSCNEDGNFDNGYLELNTLLDFGNKIVHFAGIGSGMNFYYNGNGNVPDSYAEWAKDRFGVYMKLFYDEEIDYDYDKKTCKILKEQLDGK